MEEILKEVVMSGMFRASTIPEVCDAYFMVVPTPFKGNHEPDISYVGSSYAFRNSVFKGRGSLCDRINFTSWNHRVNGEYYYLCRALRT